MRTIDTYPDINPFNGKTEGRVLGWWSGGIASAIACKLALEKYGDNVRLILCDTNREHPDTYRFKEDFERVLGTTIYVIKSKKYSDPEAVWRKYGKLNIANNAVCTKELKARPRIRYQNTKEDFAQVFGFDYRPRELNRATSILVNNPDLNPIFPLIVEKINREDLFVEIKKLGIKEPIIYQRFLNNNCIGADDSEKGGCVLGGIGYWKKIRDLYPKKFAHMAKVEHEISKAQGKPVTICLDTRKNTKGNKLFLLPSKDFPKVEDISVIKGRKPVTIFECTGFCSTETKEEDT